jgi:hypothetical protein
LEINNEIDLIKHLDNQRNFILFYFKETMTLGYQRNENKKLANTLECIENLLFKLTFSNLKRLLSESSNRRLKEIVSGEQLLIDIINLPFDYRLIIDMENIDDIDTSNALVFKAVNKKYCMFKHKNYCNKQGLEYVRGKWQNI